jgi:predicted nucleic acid-binding protein
MTGILDTSFLFALTDQSDRNHQPVLAIAQSVNALLVLPVVVLPEICYLIASRLGHQVMIGAPSDAPFCVQHNT